MDVRVYCAEMFFDLMVEISGRDIQYHQPPKYPAALRDLALTVDEDVEVGAMEKVIKACDSELIKSVKLFDVYRGEQVAEGKKSVAFSLMFRHVASFRKGNYNEGGEGVTIVKMKVE